jgi:hypothetical protein
MRLAPWSMGSKRRTRRALAPDLSLDVRRGSGPAAEARSSPTRRGRSRGLVLAAIGAAFCLAITGRVALAASYNNSFDISGPTGYGGSGRAFGELTYFPSPRTQMRVGGNVGDICPGDSKGVGLVMRVLQTNGVYWLKYVEEYPWTCGSGWDQINPPRDYFAPNAINQARAELWTYEQHVPQSSFVVGGWKVHP